MSLSIETLIENCIRELHAGTLTEINLLEVLTNYKNHPKGRQDILYLQSQSTSVISPVHGMSLVENGNVYDGPNDPKNWPYKTVLDAINDGWRIIKFPEMALLMDQDRTYGLGREFILERWSK
jgi:hypothetical protein